MKTEQALLNEMAYYALHEDMEQFYKTEELIERMDTKEEKKKNRRDEDE